MGQKDFKKCLFLILLKYELCEKNFLVIQIKKTFINPNRNHKWGVGEMAQHLREPTFSPRVLEFNSQYP